MKRFPIFVVLAKILSTFALKDENIGYFWHVTDFHLDSNYSTGDLKSRDYYLGDYAYDICWNSENPGIFGNFNCDAPEALVKSAISFLETHSRETLGLDKVSFILWTGDDTAHYNDTLYGSMKESLAAIELITNYLNDTKIPFFPVLGNHDAFPHNQFSDDPLSELYVETAEIWRYSAGWSQDSIDSGYQQYLRNGGFYTSKIGPFRLVGLNTNMWYSSNHQTINNPSHQFTWLEEVLKDARYDNEKVLLFAHIPPGKFERFYQYFDPVNQYGYYWFKPQLNSYYLKVIESFSDVIHLQLYGHHHTDTFKLIKKDGKVIDVGLLAPAVTPWKSTLAPETGANNPSIRLFKYDKVSGEILDYEQFWMDLEKANQEGKATWTSEYTFKTYFEVEDLSASSFEKIFERMYKEDEYFEKYFRINSVQKLDGNGCDSNCKAYHLCAIEWQDYDQFNECIIARNSAVLQFHGISYLIVFLMYLMLSQSSCFIFIGKSR